jgi:class 3 adenylate cyclase
MQRTIEELEARIRDLETENARLKTVASIAITNTMHSSAKSSGGLTVMGAEEMVLQVGPDDTVSYVNAPMAKLLGISNRKLAMGQPYAQWDHGAIGEGVIATLVQVARSSDEQHVLERACPGLPTTLLPETKGARPSGDPILRFTAAGMKGRVQIAVQDITRLRWLENTFSRYVAPAVIEQMQDMDAKDFLTTERRTLTILFGDIRGFTAISQELAPEQVQEMVNSFLENMVDCIERLDGTIDKFVGDEVMAIFGAPVPQTDHAMRAIVCAVEMQRVHSEWMKQRTAEGKPARPMGIGIATGSVVVGNIGTKTRMDYTVLGHTVNLAARLCGSAEGGEVLTVASTHAAAAEGKKAYAGRVPLPHLSFASKEKMSFKNVRETVEVFSVVRKD